MGIVSIRGGVKMRVIFNGRDITEDLTRITIQEGTKNSDAFILKLWYNNGEIATKVLMPFPNHNTHVILRR